jgi:ubiquinone/menaquinone biosynthesis C-methylase UbiE
MEARKDEWNASYRTRETFIYYPHEEIVRFVSKYVRKRTGLHSFQNAGGGDVPPRLLDLGCGSGRHVVYAHEMGLEAYGIDVSDTAVEQARAWAEEAGMRGAAERIVAGDVRALPWGDGTFDAAVSHGVLDSMHFEIAQAGMRETSRVLKAGGWFYCDLVSGDDSRHAREFAGEEIADWEREKGTVQSYFNFGKLERLTAGLFEMAECFLIRKENLVRGGYISRYHLTLRKI